MRGHHAAGLTLCLAGVALACSETEQPPRGCEACVTLADDQQVEAVGIPFGIATDGTNVYWANRGGEGAIMKVPVGGGTPTTLASSQMVPQGIAVDHSDVYWANLDAVWKIPIEGGEPFKLADTSLLRDDFGDFAVAIDTTRVYWHAITSIVAVEMAGGTPTILADNQDPAPHGVAIDDTAVYWAADFQGIMKTPLDGALSGNSTVEIASESLYVTSLAVDDQNVYWVANGSLDAKRSKIQKASKNGGSVVTLASEQDGGSRAIAADETTVYWTTDHAIMSVPIDGGPVATLAPSEYTPRDIAVDDKNIYWTSDDKVRKRPK